MRDWLNNRTAIEQSAPTEATALPTPTSVPTVAPQLTASEEHTPVEFTVTGNTTFQNLLDWGLTQETIEAVIGGVMPDASFVIRQYITGQGLKFSEIKIALQAEVDKVK